MASHDHENEHDHEHGSDLSETQLRVRALETVLSEKGYIDPAALDAIVDYYETKVGPRNGAMVVAKAWRDAAFRQALLADATKAVGTLGHVSRVGDHLVAVENTPKRHNMVVCTLCSCYPWESSGFRRSGTSLHLIARVQSKTHAVCSPTSASRCQWTQKSAYGTLRRRRVSLWCRCVPRAQRAGARRNLPS